MLYCPQVEKAIINQHNILYILEDTMTMLPISHKNHRSASSRKSSRIPAALCASLALLLTLGVSNALASGPNGGYTNNNRGGFTGPGPAVTTVNQAKSMRDDSHVTLEGHIVRHIGGDRYLFEDNTGSINVEIENKRWQGQTVGPNDLVEISGELDKDWSEMEIDVKRIVKK
ncbi:YgiW/YdeI family stress tolerance OB fold protein [Mailhella sp.]|uniref:YgiW/YdeI family stress tolerance OB fold protein n=1 Tax=Mailhella sp. TaxID=1981029 RepID=UPI003AB3C17B